MAVPYIVIDFETYYDKEYSLKKLTPAEYILDPRFEVTGCAIIVAGRKPLWVDADKLPAVLPALPRPCTVISHNALFDMSILSWRYGIVPDLMVDTMGMARALLYHITGSVSLESVANWLGLPPKGKSLLKVQGLNAEGIKQAGLWQEYTDYAKHDAWLCEQVFLKLKEEFPRSEYELMDMVLRCAVTPQFVLDSNLLAEHRHTIEQYKHNLLTACGLSDRLQLMSNDMFAGALARLGVDPPKKISPVTGRETYAFAKTDPEMIALSEHPDPAVQALVAARVGHKSTIEETRAAKLLNISLLSWPDGSVGKAPIALRNYGAHTGRLSGDWKLNAQNWPRYTIYPGGMKETGKLRRAHKAPPGHKVVKCDAKQIEARIVAWLAGEHALLDAFKNGEDIYSDFASKNIYGHKVTKSDVNERFVGKTAVLGLGYGLGPEKFMRSLAAGSYVNLGYEIKIDPIQATKIVREYRVRFKDIPKSWWNLGNFIQHMTIPKFEHDWQCVKLGFESITLPNGYKLQYYNLHQEVQHNNSEWMFHYGREKKKIYGAKMFENIVQALARIVTMEVARRVKKEFPAIPLVHQVHDDLVYIVPNDIVPEFSECLLKEMGIGPWWALGLPLEGELGVGDNYGDAK